MYWMNPGPENLPEAYLMPGEDRRSRYLVRLVRRFCHTGNSICEIGCNAGRNLAHLWRAGFHLCSGIEPNPQALVLARTRFPESDKWRLTCCAAEEELPRCRPDQYDVLLTMAVLEHIPDPEAQAIFAHMARIARIVITIEDEHSSGDRHTARNYGAVFGGLGMHQVYARRCWQWLHGLSGAFVARVHQASARNQAVDRSRNCQTGRTTMTAQRIDPARVKALLEAQP